MTVSCHVRMQSPNWISTTGPAFTWRCRQNVGITHVTSWGWQSPAMTEDDNRRRGRRSGFKSIILEREITVIPCSNLLALNYLANNCMVSLFKFMFRFIWSLGIIHFISHYIVHWYICIELLDCINFYFCACLYHQIAAGGLCSLLNETVSFLMRILNRRNNSNNNNNSTVCPVLSKILSWRTLI